MHPTPTRRAFVFLGLTGFVAAACRSSSSPQEARRAPAPTPAPTPVPRPVVAPEAARVACAATEPNIEGPYWRAGAPMRSDLVPVGSGGRVITLSGVVRSSDCATPLAGATLDLWQADEAGRYDNDGSSPELHGALRLRGRVACDARGAFSVRTVVPGRYLNGARYRPAHIHVKLAAPGHAPLTTQLYFPDDPFNADDAFYRPSLVMELADDRARYDFALVPAG